MVVLRRNLVASGALTLLLGAILPSWAHAAPTKSFTRHFASTTTLVVKVPAALASPACATRVVLPSNHLQISFSTGRRRTWRLYARAKQLGSTRARTGHRLLIRVNADLDTIWLGAGSNPLQRRVVLRSERSVQVFTRLGRSCRGDRVTVTTKRAPGSSPLPAAGQSPPTRGDVGRPPSALPFAPDSVWNKALSDDAPLDPKSAVYVSDLNRQLQQWVPYMNTTQYSTPVYTVPADQPVVRVNLDEVAAFLPALQLAWERVPVPPGARAAAGTDGNLVVWQPSKDTLWEFWRASRQTDGWHARYGGRMEHVSSNPGYFTSPTTWGASASSLAILGGLVRLDELAAGRIDHALAMGIPELRAGWYSWPAQRTDGTIASEDAIPEGARFRVDPRLDLSTLSMAPVVRMLAEAAQRYGIVVRDRAGAITFYGEDPGPTGSNPYLGPTGYFGGAPIHELLRQFPWAHLQVLRTQLAQR